MPSCGGGSDDSDAEIPAGPFVGVAPEGDQNATDYARMADGGVGVVRIVFQWSSIETSKGTYDWAATDQVMADIASAGLEPLVTVFGTPGIYEKVPTDPPTTSEDTLDAWSDFLSAAAERYGEDGDFWNDFAEANPDVTPQPIREWEIWNEPNSSNFWTPKPDPAAYAELIERSSKALDKADPKAQVMSGGMFATPQSDGAIVSYDFIDQLYAQDGVDDAIDIVGVHPYGPDVDSVTTQVEDTRKALDKAGKRHPHVGDRDRLGLGSGRQERSLQGSRAAGEPALGIVSFPLRLARRNRCPGGGLVHVARLGRRHDRVLWLVCHRRPRRRRPRQQAVLGRPHRPDRRDPLSA